MYPEKVPYWQRGQLITAERLNKAVRMLNWLLDIAADNDSDQQDDGESEGDVKVLPPGGSIPPTPYYDNPPVEVVDAAGQPFLKLGDVNVETVPPPVFALKTAIPGEVPGTPYYTNVTTDKVGNVESVEVSESPISFQLWDGAVKGKLSVCTGALIQDEFGETHTFDSNPVFLPVLPVSLFPACGSATNANGDSITVHSLVDSVVGNSVPIKPLVAGAGVVITEEVSAGETPASYLVVSAGTSELDAAGQPFIAPGTENPSDADVEYLIPPVAGNAERSSPDIPGTPYYTNVTTDNFGRPTNVSVSSSMMTTQLWDGSAGGVFSACTGALNVDANGNYYSIDGNPIFLPVIPISFFGACGNATNDNGDSVEVHNLVDSAVGNSVPIKPLVAGEGVVLTDESLPTGWYPDSSATESLRAGYVRMSLSALTYQPEASSPSYEPSLGGLRSVTYATASEVASGTQYPRVENGNLVLFPGAVAYDSNKFALVKQGSFWVLTIPETDCTPTVGTPLFAAD